VKNVLVHCWDFVLSPNVVAVRCVERVAHCGEHSSRVLGYTMGSMWDLKPLCGDGEYKGGKEDIVEG